MRKVVGKDVKVTEAMVEAVVNDGDLSKSAKMKALFDWGLSIAEIANVLGVRYNFVYNVITNYVSAKEINTTHHTKTTKREMIVELCKQGKSNKEIATELGANYSYVYNVVKAYKEATGSAEEVAATVEHTEEREAPKKGFMSKLQQKLFRGMTLTW